jgi:hypothetical protein
VDATHYDFQLRQRLTSSALNAQEAWTSRLSPEALRALVAGDTGNVSGVLDGLLVTVQVGTLNVQIGGGLALLYDSTQSAPASTHRWIEVGYSAPITATHDAGDGANPRWDVVEIEPGNVDGSGEVLDFYNPNTGAFVPLVAAPLKVCTPVVTIRKGTPAANPKFPAGVAGRIPLAYVYVATAAVALNANRVVYCRPILEAKRYTGAPNKLTEVCGGGWQRSSLSLVGEIAQTMKGRFSTGSQFHLPAGTVATLSASGNYHGGGLPVASGTVYMYAAPPPYPSGYDAVIAPREIFTPDATVMGACYPAGSYGAILIATDIPPTPDYVGAPTPAGTITITDNLFGAVSIATTQCIYVGAAYFSLGDVALRAQTYKGAVSSGAGVAGKDINALLPIAADTDVSMAANQGLDPAYRLPAHVRRIHLQGFHRLSVQGDFDILIKDALSDIAGNSYRHSQYRSNIAADIARGITAWVYLDDLQKLTINYADGNGLSASNVLRAMAWEDPVIAAR